MFIVLVKEWLLPELAVFLALAAIILAGILSPEEALNGFSNPGVHTVAFLFILGAAFSNSGILHELIYRILSKSNKLPHILVRVMLPVSALSAFMNNTPIVTMLIPTLQSWAISNNIKPSKLLIPLSYGAILGGTITLIGTSTNLIVQGLLLDKGLPGFHLFDFSYFGIPLTLAGVCYFFVAGHRLLPNRVHNTKQFKDEEHLHIYKFAVEKKSPIAGKTINEAMLRNLNQIFLVEIIRNGRKIIPDPIEEIILADDILVFSGNPQGVTDISKNLGLSPVKKSHGDNSLTDLTILYEVGISGNSPLVNQKIKDIHFRSKFNAAIVAIKRKGIQFTTGIGKYIIKPGDTLLVIAKRDFEKTWSKTEDFYFISPVQYKKNISTFSRTVLCLILLGIILFSIFQLLPIFHLALCATVILLTTNIMTVSAAIKSINWNVIILMGCSIGIGKAVEITGLAQIASSLLTMVQSNFGIIGTMIIFYIVTTALTEILNNLATAALMFPIGFSISQHLHVDPAAFAMITAIAASCSFLSPIGYQTNMLVYGPGGYRFNDYLKVGLPLSFICMSVTISIAYLKLL